MVNKVIRIALLGSTGSIGRQTLDIVRSFNARFKIIGLACRKDSELFAQQVNEFKPEYICTETGRRSQGSPPYCTLEEMASLPEVDVIVIATTGKAGLRPALAALKAGKQVALANKEILAMAGPLITTMASEYGATILPIDSEHCAIWQCLRGEEAPVSRILLTASGGPFLGRPADALAKVTASDALKHPTWKMGPKVTIDSATLFNKGLEVIEAHWLFNIPYDKIEILIHRQSIVHSMVEFQDGSVKAQLSYPDMHLPIQYALFYPQRVSNDGISCMDFAVAHTLTFEPVVYGDYPCLKLALEAAGKGGTYPAVLCAADEVAVDLFLKNSIRFTEIATIIEKTLDMHRPVSSPGLEDILRSDEWACETALKAARKDI
jgi:1-deoxy-D-xylulose-5-phosphate reductoisomerase